MAMTAEKTYKCKSCGEPCDLGVACPCTLPSPDDPIGGSSDVAFDSPDRFDNMLVSGFASWQYVMSRRFEVYWKKSHEQDPENFPERMNLADWEEQYQAWLALPDDQKVASF